MIVPVEDAAMSGRSKSASVAIGETRPAGAVGAGAGGYALGRNKGINVAGDVYGDSINSALEALKLSLSSAGGVNK